MEFQFLFVVEVPDQPAGDQELDRYVHRGAFQFVFVVEVSGPPVGSQELELESRIG